MKAPKIIKRLPIYAYVSADTRDFIRKLNQASSLSEGKILDRAIDLLKATKLK